MSEGRRCAAEKGRAEPEDADGPPLELVVAVDARQPQRHIREHRIAGGRRIVVELFLSVDEPLAVGRRVEEAASFVVGEQLDRERREPP